VTLQVGIHYRDRKQAGANGEERVGCSCFSMSTALCHEERERRVDGVVGCGLGYARRIISNVEVVMHPRDFHRHHCCAGFGLRVMCTIMSRIRILNLCVYMYVGRWSYGESKDAWVTQYHTSSI